MDVSVIIVNYNTRSLTLHCIESIYKQTNNIDFEIILVDNGSSDDTCESVKKTFPEILIIEVNENLGFGRANNLGAKNAKGKYLFFLNSDTILLNNAILNFFKFNEKNSDILNIGITGGILLDENKLETGSFGPLPTMTNILKSILKLLPPFTRMTEAEKKSFKKNEYLEVEYITGADMFLLKSLFNTVGGFDPNFFMYYEETDLQKRLKNIEYHNYVINGIQIIHLEGASIKRYKTNNLKRLIVTKSMFYYFRKHSDRLSFYVFKFLFLVLRLPTLFHKNYSWVEKRDYILQIIKS